MNESKLDRDIRRLRDSVDFDEEDSKVTVVMQHAPKSQSVPAPAKGLVAVLNVLPPWGRVLVTLAVIGAATYGGHQLGWW